MCVQVHCGSDVIVVLRSACVHRMCARQLVDVIAEEISYTRGLCPLASPAHTVCAVLKACSVLRSLNTIVRHAANAQPL